MIRIPTQLLCLLAIMMLSTSPLEAQTITAPRLQGVTETMKRYIHDGEVAGAVTLVMQDGKIVHLESAGFADLAVRRPMQPDDLFWIASVTKPMTAAAIMMLCDDGKLSVDDPVEKYLPLFKDPWVISEKSEQQMVLKRAGKPITLRDLLTHTSGLIGDIGTPLPGTPLAEWVNATARLPLHFEPGTQWQYSNAGTNALGRVIEVVSGQSYESFLQERLFTPLGMVDTTFWPTEAQLKRLAKSYRLNEARGLEEMQSPFINGPITSRARTVVPAGGLFSTATDVLRFLQMLLDGGTSNGKRYLSEKSVQLMTTTQTGDIVTGFTDGMSFGLGCGVVKVPQGQTGMLSPGSFGHGGAYGNAAWVDPIKRRIFIMMIQRSNLTPHGDGSEIRRAFQQAVVDALDAP